MTKSPQIISFQKFHYTTPLNVHEFPCHIFHTQFHCSHLPILSYHKLLSDNSFPQYTLLIAVPYSMSKSDLYVNVGKRILLLKPLFTSLNIFLPLLTIASDLITHLPFTALSLIFPSMSPCLEHKNITLFANTSTFSLPTFFLHLHHLIPLSNMHSPSQGKVEAILSPLSLE